MIKLKPMTQALFEPYLEALNESFAADHVAAGNWRADEAVRKATEQTSKLLPDGLKTSGHSLFVIESSESGARVGSLWVAIQERGGKESLWIYDVQIDDPFRQQGYGSAAFIALEEMAKQMGMMEISLHVFGGNVAARGMYTKLGYNEVDVVMSKEL